MSVAKAHFPIVRFRDGKRLIFDPVRKKSLVSSPEERVRQQWIQYLNLECGIPLSRLSVENGLKIPQEENLSRTDMVFYDANFKPLVLLEIKAPHIALKPGTMIQARRYNQNLGAPLILLSNGLTDILCNAEGNVVEREHWITELKSKCRFTRDFSYWQERGFLNSDYPQVLNWLGSQAASSATWVNFDTWIDGIDGHYAFVSKPDKHWLAAAVFTGVSGKNHFWMAKTRDGAAPVSICLTVKQIDQRLALLSADASKELLPIDADDHDLESLINHLSNQL
jgi:hypothetical protein